MALGTATSSSYNAEYLTRDLARKKENGQSEIMFLTENQIKSTQLKNSICEKKIFEKKKKKSN